MRLARVGKALGRAVWTLIFRTRIRNVLILATSFVAICVAFYFLPSYDHEVVDGAKYLFPATNEIWSGEASLYENDDGFYNPPWSLLIYKPFASLPTEYGIAAFRGFSLLCMVLSVGIFFPDYWGKKSPIMLVIALAFAPMYYLISWGQVDGLVVLGVALGWHAVRNEKINVFTVAMLLILIKPHNVLLVILLYLYLVIVSWSAENLLQVIFRFGFVYMLTGLFAGFAWPINWIFHALRYPPIQGTSAPPFLLIEHYIPVGGDVVYILAVLLLLVFFAFVAIVQTPWKEMATQTVIFGSVLSLFTSTYVQPYHLVILIFAVVYLLERHIRLGFPALILLWFPIFSDIAGSANLWPETIPLYYILFAVIIGLLKDRQKLAVEHMKNQARESIGLPT